MSLTVSMGQAIARLHRVCPLADACPGMALVERYAVIAKPNVLDPMRAQEFRRGGAITWLATRRISSDPNWLPTWRGKALLRSSTPRTRKCTKTQLWGTRT
eukprot:1389588-Amphidinium_carterae.1